MDAILSRAKDLKLALLDFIFDAEGELATALETYSAERLAQLPQTPGRNQDDWIVDLFLIEGRVGQKTPLELFVDSQPDLSESDRQLIHNWHRSFVGLFVVQQVVADEADVTLDVMNWMTGKPYAVRPNGLQSQEQLDRLKPGEILLAQITPIDAERWMLTGSFKLLGKLGKPKLAVAIGNFKDQYKTHRYGDAPELLEEAWRSIEHYYQEFVDFFGSDELTLPGYQLNKKFAEFQDVTTKKRLEAAGIDPSKSLETLAAESGVSKDELVETAADFGVDTKSMNQLLNQPKTQMVPPAVDLPDALKKAEQVTVLAHPRWGQLFFTQYAQLKHLLETESWDTAEPIPQTTSQLFQTLLKDPAISAYLWYRLAEQYPTQLEQALRQVLNRHDFTLATDLDSLLQEFGKPIEPDLPAIASVPLHLHNLFQDAFQDVNKNKAKAKVQRKAASGFQR